MNVRKEGETSRRRESWRVKERRKGSKMIGS
jgi:hypothetical protein